MNRRLFYLDRSSRIIGREGPGYQGHPGQFLAMLAQIGVPADFPMQIQQRRFTVLDLVNREQQSVRADQELTFRLIALAHYLPTDASWVNELGETWDLAKILGVELASPINGAPCGGTHRIMACSVAVLERAADGLPIDGNFARAQKYVEDYQKYAFSLQNRDGSFSSDWFKRPARWGDKDRQLQTTGHILEWLVYSLPRHRLSDPQVVRAVHFLSELMVAHRFHEWEVGPRGHALRALSLYRQRVFPSPDAQPLAGQSKQQR